jgi:GTP-binding protein
MRIISAAYLKSAARPADWPGPGQDGPERPEIAFCGRSNVGKSTLLNALLGRKSLARVSQTPGRTRLVNFFTVEALPDPGEALSGPISLMVTDLPGFGYAKVGKAERSTWRPLIQGYLSHRAPLRVVVVLCDSRRVLDLKEEPDALFEEVELARWLAAQGREVVPVMTKADKLSKHERKPAAAALSALLGRQPVIFSSLSTTQESVDELWRRIARALGAPSQAAAADPRLDP